MIVVPGMAGPCGGQECGRRKTECPFKDILVFEHFGSPQMFDMFIVLVHAAPIRHTRLKVVDDSRLCNALCRIEENRVAIG